ncbi:MAG: hypothetical protein K1000chlam2_01011 [Chlamydiae bacterium]|nr:hypothetical protein [Chlamydiota bacterium]
MPRFFIADKPTPVLNTPDFQGVFGTHPLPLDKEGLLRPIEMVALQGTKFEFVRQMSAHIFEVKTQDYLHGPLYIDARFVSETNENTPNRPKILPSSETILSRLKNALGLPYIWGGNWGRGIPEIHQFYGSNLKPQHKIIQTLSGLDCSGLLYEATNGFIPRNTSELLIYGKKVPHFDHVKPLDILVWPGHVVIVLTPTTTIESLYGQGVILSDLHDRLHQLSSTKFIIRRFLFE